MNTMFRLTLYIVAVIFIFTAAGYLVGGIQLVLVGGSPYYLLAGLVLLVCAVLLWRRVSWVSWVYALLLIATLGWSLWEVGIDPWALLPRIVLLAVLGLLLLLPAVRRGLNQSGTVKPLLSTPHGWIGLLGVVLIIGIIVYLGGQYEVRSPSPPTTVTTPINTRTDWQQYGNSKAGTRFSVLDQINADNVGDLDVAWVSRTGVGGVAKATPSQVGDLLYVCNGGNVVQALDAENGDLRWQFDPQIDQQQLLSARYFTTTCRGVTYYEAPQDYQGECPQRILTATTDARLIALDAHSGERCTSFGNSGEVDLSKQMGHDPPIFYFVTSPPALVRGNAVVGGWVLDNRKVKEPSGTIRAFNAITGNFAWAWDMGRPNDYGEPPLGDTYTLGTPNVWSLFSVDEERGIVYGPTGNETPDYFGNQRLEASEKYASSVVALDGESGKLLWSFQTVHHDIWDYDVPSQPVLVDIPNEDGSITPALIQPTKRGELFLLNRVTGKPVAEVKELPVPQGGVPEDWTSLTQPFSVGMPNYREPDFREADMWGVTPFDQLWCRIQFRKMRYEGHFTPPTTEYMIQYPGNAGGFNWGSVAVDEANQILVASPMIMANRMRLIPREEMAAGVRGSAQAGTPYGATTEMFTSPLQIPCFKPPYGVLAAIDLRTHQELWRRPIGDAYDSGPLGIHFKLPWRVGTPVSGGTLVTGGGLIFIGGTLDRSLRAIDIKTGEELWHYRLPLSAQATPMTYLSPGGEQTIILVVPAYIRSSIGEPRAIPPDQEDPEGGYVFAFRLPKQ